MKIKTLRNAAFSAAMAGGLALTVFAGEQTDIGQADQAMLDKVHPTKPPYSPYAGRNFPTRPLFGDTHLHTGLSFDAGIFGCRLGPADAYRFARGEEVTASSGQRVKLSRPLDWLVVADHSDNMGLINDIIAGQVATVRAHWARVVARVAGSWIAAIGLLMLGWSLRGGQ